jgi:pyruvyltransferase
MSKNIFLSVKENLSEKIKTELIDLIVRPWESYRLDWYSNTDNLGDILNPILVQALTGKKIVQVAAKRYRKPHYFVIGSILSRATKYTTVWGAGFISAGARCVEKPAEICAVRGPKTRDSLLAQGIQCPEVYGDPALLLPKLFLPKADKQYKIGIIPHYVDKDQPSLQKMLQDPDIKLIDIQDPNPYNFIMQMLSCEKIVSSSLHGIIIADAYGIPSLWGEFINEVMGAGFKFFDYFDSVKRKDEAPVNLSEITDLNVVLPKFNQYQIEFDTDKLLEACPFELEFQIPYIDR